MTEKEILHLIGEYRANKTFEKLKEILNTPPPPEWIKERKIQSVQNGIPVETNYKYVSIDRKEFLMTELYSGCEREIKTVIPGRNIITIVLRVHYAGLFNEGVGSRMFNEHNAMDVQAASPAAKSLAFSDAVEDIGIIFGKDLNRGIDPVQIEAKPEVKETKERVKVAAAVNDLQKKLSRKKRVNEK